jgi:hypothetical protein
MPPEGVDVRQLGTVRSRLTFAAVACLLMVVAVAGRLAWDRHQQQSLDRDPSSLYGAHVLRDVIEYLPGNGESARTRCSNAVAVSPGIRDYSVKKALTGCLDEYTGLNE